MIKHERSPEPFVRAVERQAPVTEVQVLKPGEPQSSAQRGPDERRGEAVRDAVGERGRREALIRGDERLRRLRPGRVRSLRLAGGYREREEILKNPIALSLGRSS